MKRLIFAVLVCVSCAMMSGCAGWSGEKVNSYRIDPNAHSAVTPATRPDWWPTRHQAVVDRVKEGNVDLIFIGDSITHGWERGGKDVWQQYYAKRNAVNMGFSGDRTQHVLWRLDNGEIAGISPKLAIIMIGTNNSNKDDNTAKQISDGIIVICQKLRHDLPNTKILLLAIFPRGERPSAQREKNAEASKLASAIADNKWIYYMNINDKFLDKDGTLPKDIMPDFLHPNAKGYQIEAETIEPMVKKLMGEKELTIDMEKKSQGPLAVISVIMVFALAIAIFAGVGLACKYLLAKYIESEGLRTALSLAIAAAATLAVMHALKLLNRRVMKQN